MKVYLDNCCFNRPYDDQSHLRIRLEAEAKLKIQEEIRNGSFKQCGRSNEGFDSEMIDYYLASMEMSFKETLGQELQPSLCVNGSTFMCVNWMRIGNWQQRTKWFEPLM